MSRFLSLLLLLVLVVPATAQNVEVGYASWYNRGFHGLSTASGEAYDHDALTAAHPTLAFGSLIRVTRTDDERSVLVRVNDRMESGPGHVIDLSGAAARELGMLDSGVARVRVISTQDAGESVATATYTSVASVETTPTPTGAYTLQLGVFSAQDSAERVAGRLDGAWVQSIATDTGTMYRVYYRNFESAEVARSEQSHLWATGVESFLRSLR